MLSRSIRAITLAYAGMLLAGAGVCAHLAFAQAIPASAGAREQLAGPAASREPVRTIPALLRRAHLPGPYLVEPLNVVDGDTFEGRLRIWFGHEITTLVRLRNVDAPELKSRCASEAKLAVEARQALGDILRAGTVMLSDLQLDKYAGRIVADVSVSMSAEALDDAGALLLAAGYARPYRGGRRQAWCS